MKVSEKVLITVSERIRRGDLLPGDTVDESSLASEFNVSRTPVREALLQLQSQGLLTSMPRGGMVVAKMDIQQLLAMWELLAELEGICARLACERMTPAEVKDLEAAHAASRAPVEANDLDGWQQHNSAFHEILFRGSRNPYVRHEILRLRSMTGAYRRHAFAALGAPLASFDQHAEVVRAIAARDCAAAAAAMMDHMRPGGQTAKGLADFIANLPRELLR